MCEVPLVCSGRVSRKKAWAEQLVSAGVDCLKHEMGVLLFGRAPYVGGVFHGKPTGHV